MVGYDSWTDNACNMHVALDSRYATRPLLREAFKVVFDRLGKGVVFGAVRSDNPHALDFDKRLGFRELTVLRDAQAKGVHIHVLEMRREALPLVEVTSMGARRWQGRSGASRLHGSGNADAEHALGDLLVVARAFDRRQLVGERLGGRASRRQ
jgi:cytosine/adenosine deaminase-related metal-dependent hydrolase